MQATKGSGRIVPLGSIQKVMRESIEAAAQYIKAKHSGSACGQPMQTINCGAFSCDSRSIKTIQSAFVKIRGEK